MKRIIKYTALLLLALAALLCASCADKSNTSELWTDALYTSDTAVGDGENKLFLEIAVGDKSVTLTVNTDKETLGEALFSLGIINDPTFFNTCNGITADFSKDKAYWAFYVGDEETIASFGVGDGQAVTAGEPTYRLVYTK